MSKQIISVVACAIIFVAVFSACYATTVPDVCKPGTIEHVPSHIKKVCLALKNSGELASALESYIKEAGDAVKKSVGKRTDIDHIFLPFGKRR